MNSTARMLTAAVFALMLPAGAAQAEIVLLTSGKTLSITGHRIEGETIVLAMRNGGEVTCDRSLVEKILPDELIHQEPAASSPVDEPGTRPSAVPSGPYAEIITSLAEAHGVDPMLVGALIQVESNNRPKARSHKGAMGLMQLMPSTARHYNVRNPYDPSANIAAGVKHLKSLIDRLGAVDLALAAYNAGEGAVKKFNGIPPYRETRNYISRILSLAGIR